MCQVQAALVYANRWNHTHDSLDIETFGHAFSSGKIHSNLENLFHHTAKPDQASRMKSWGPALRLVPVFVVNLDRRLPVVMIIRHK